MEEIELWDWRRRVAALYRDVGESSGPEAWERWRKGRDELFRSHPQSALPPEARAGFAGLAYFPHDPAWRVLGRIEPAPEEPVVFGHSGDGSTAFRRFARVRFAVAGQEASLSLHWLEGYGGGVFLPFRDATCGKETYGGGRYLLDTAKGADLGWEGEEVVLDFNYAYHPSCFHDPRWSCPLPPAENTLPFQVNAGEKLV